jgi:hypothetical protein
VRNGDGIHYRAQEGDQDPTNGLGPGGASSKSVVIVFHIWGYSVIKAIAMQEIMEINSTNLRGCSINSGLGRDPEVGGFCPDWVRRWVFRRKLDLHRQMEMGVERMFQGEFERRNLKVG